MDYYDHLNNKTRATEYGDALIFEKEVSLLLHTSAFCFFSENSFSHCSYAYILKLKPPNSFAIKSHSLKH